MSGDDMTEKEFLFYWFYDSIIIIIPDSTYLSYI